MEIASTRKKFAAIDILKNYNGNNSYILLLKHHVVVLGDSSCLNEFSTEYILRNHETEPKTINKVTRISDWYGEAIQKKYSLDFTPKKLIIVSYLGDMPTQFHCFIKYRHTMEPIKEFVPKNAVIDNFFVSDYSNIEVDFGRYDRLSMSKDPTRKIRDHQKEAVKFLLGRKKCILADDMGLGKTNELAIAAIEGNFDSIIVICPQSLKVGWKNELKWYVPERDITIVDGYLGKNKSELEESLGYGIGRSGKTVKELQDEAKEVGKWRDNRFVIINYDILSDVYKIPAGWSASKVEAALQESPMLQYIKDKKALIIIDEAHKLSNSGSDQYRIIKDLIKRGKPHSIYLATGTPITNNPQNYFNLLQLIGDPIADDWDYYSKTYCDARMIPKKGEKQKWEEIYLKNVAKKKTWFDLTPDEKEDLKQYINTHAQKIRISSGSSNLDELKERTSHIYLRRTKEDIGDIPTKHIHEIFYDLSMQQMFEYNRLWEEYEHEKRTLDPDKEINKELLEGGVYRKYCSNQMVPNTIKLADYFINKGEKVVIACCYDEELYTLRDYYGDKCVVYNGKMSLKEKEEAKDAFINNPDKMVFIGNIIAAGVGITLVVSNKLIFNNIDYVPGNCRQMEDRIHRIGQTKEVDIYYQMFKGTQYATIWNTVMRKELVINSVIKKENEK